MGCISMEIILCITAESDHFVQSVSPDNDDRSGVKVRICGLETDNHDD